MSATILMRMMKDPQRPPQLDTAIILLDKVRVETCMHDGRCLGGWEDRDGTPITAAWTSMREGPWLGVWLDVRLCGRTVTGHH